MDHYILVGKTPVACDLETWANWFETADRIVMYHELEGCRVSTVFLGLDYSFGGREPMLFETMVFGMNDHLDQYCARCSTWKDAEIQHHWAIMWVLRRAQRHYEWCRKRYKRRR